MEFILWIRVVERCSRRTRSLDECALERPDERPVEFNGIPSFPSGSEGFSHCFGRLTPVNSLFSMSEREFVGESDGQIEV